MKLGRSPSPATVRDGRFLKLSRRSTSLAAGSSIPRSPSVAPATGGRGIVDPRLVHSVGSSRRPVGGAVEAVVRSARRVLADLVPFDDDALRSFVVEIPPFPSSQIFGSAVLIKPSPAMAWRPGRNLLNKEKTLLRSFVLEMQGRGVSSQELATGDFPSAEGLYLIQAIKRYGGGGAPPAASSSSSTSGSRGHRCNFLLFLGLSVRTVL